MAIYMFTVYLHEIYAAFVFVLLVVWSHFSSFSCFASQFFLWSVRLQQSSSIVHLIYTHVSVYGDVCVFKLHVNVRWTEVNESSIYIIIIFKLVVWPCVNACEMFEFDVSTFSTRFTQCFRLLVCFSTRETFCTDLNSVEFMNFEVIRCCCCITNIVCPLKWAFYSTLFSVPFRFPHSGSVWRTDFLDSRRNHG